MFLVKYAKDGKTKGHLPDDYPTEFRVVPENYEVTVGWHRKTSEEFDELWSKKDEKLKKFLQKRKKEEARLREKIEKELEKQKVEKEKQIDQERKLREVQEKNRLIKADKKNKLLKQIKKAKKDGDKEKAMDMMIDFLTEDV